MLLKQSTLPLDQLLVAAQSQTKHLVGWYGNPEFVKKLRSVMKRRQAIHELSAKLTSFWAADQFTKALQDKDKVTPEMLRKAAQPVKSSVEPSSPVEPALMVHSSVGADEAATLLETLKPSTDRATANAAKPAASSAAA